MNSSAIHTKKKQNNKLKLFGLLTVQNDVTTGEQFLERQTAYLSLSLAGY